MHSLVFNITTTISTAVLRDSDDRSSIGRFSFVQIDCVPRLVHESHTVFDRKAVSSAQGHLFLVDPQYLAAAPIASTKQLTSAYPQDLVFPFPCLRTQVLWSRAWSSYLFCSRRGADGFGEGPTVRTIGNLFFHFILCACKSVSSLNCWYCTLEVPMIQRQRSTGR